MPYEEGATLAELYALGAPIDEREDREDGVSSRARLPRRELRRFAPFLVADAERARVERVIELPIRRLRADAVCPVRATPATPGSTWPPASASSSAPGERAVVGTGLAVAIPEGYAGFVQPRSGLAASTGSRS